VESYTKNTLNYAITDKISLLNLSVNITSMLLSAGGIISRSVALYKEHKQLYLQYMIALFIPTALISIFGAVFNLISANKGTINPLFTGTFFILILGGTFIAFWISLGFIKAIAQTYKKEPITPIKQQLYNVKQYVWPSIIVSFLTGIIVLGGTLLLIIPGIIFAIWFSFVVYEIVLNDSASIASLKTSKMLVNGRWWKVFWRLLAPGFIFGLLTILLQGIINFPLTFVEASSTGGLLIIMFFTLLSNVASILVMPLTTAAPTILYLELKNMPVTTKKEIHA